MILDPNKFDYYLYESTNSYYILYNNIDFSILAKKLNIESDFKRIVEDYNGQVYNGEDEFENDYDVCEAINALIEFLSDEEYLIDIFRKSLIGIDFSNSYIDSVEKYYFMLTPANIEELKKHI